MKALQKTSSWKSRSRLFLPVYLLLLITLALPAHAVARCFGVPEAEEAGEQAAWSLAIEVASSNGFVDSATLGIDSGATDGYDREFDVVDPVFLIYLPPRGEFELTLYAYFYYPDNPSTAVGSSERPESTAGLTTSVIRPEDNLTWPLQVAYLHDDTALLNISWDPDRASQLAGYSLELLTLSDEVLSMEEVPNYSFEASRGIYDLTIRALSETTGLGPDQLLIVGVIAAYTLAVVIILWLRHQRRD